MTYIGRQSNTKKISSILSTIVLVLAIASIVLAYNSGASLAVINIPDYILITASDKGTYTYAIDKDRIKHDFFFPEGTLFPENSSLSSLSLIIDPQPDSVKFEVGSTIEAAGSMLKKGGYALANTVWTWTTADISKKYAESLSVPKYISLKEYVHFRTDGNCHWIPFIDYDGLLLSVGDRVIFDASLNSVLRSLSVSANECSDDKIKIETWSSFSSAAGLTVESILQSCDVTIIDTVFIMDTKEIVERDLKPISIKGYCSYYYTNTGISVIIDKTSLISDLLIMQDTSVGKAIDALSLNVEKQNDRYIVSVFSTASDFDVVNVLKMNGLTLTDTSFYIPIQ